MAPDTDLSPLDEAAVQMHELYTSFRKAGFSRSEAITIIAKVAAEAMQQASDSEPDEGTGG
jgi:hypothetical protein